MALCLWAILASRWARSHCCHQSAIVFPEIRVGFAKIFFCNLYDRDIVLEHWANKSVVFYFGMSRKRCDWACYNSVMGQCTVEKLNFDIWFQVHDGKFTYTITQVSSLQVNAQEMRKKKSILHLVSSPLFAESVCRNTHFGQSPFVMSHLIMVIVYVCIDG